MTAAFGESGPPGQPVEARYGGTCPECGERWRPGDPIRRPTRLDPWQHAACADIPDPLTPNNPVCTTCWLDHPEGACDR